MVLRIVGGTKPLQNYRIGLHVVYFKDSNKCPRICKNTLKLTPQNEPITDVSLKIMSPIAESNTNKQFKVSNTST